MTFLIGYILGLWTLAGYIRYRDARKSNGVWMSVGHALWMPFEVVCRLIGV